MPFMHSHNTASYRRTSSIITTNAMLAGCNHGSICIEWFNTPEPDNQRVAQRMTILFRRLP